MSGAFPVLEGLGLARMADHRANSELAEWRTTWTRLTQTKHEKVYAG